MVSQYRMSLRIVLFLFTGCPEPDYIDAPTPIVAE